MLSSVAVVRNWQNESKSLSVMSDSLQPHGLYSPQNSPGQNTGVGSCSLLQGIFLTQGLNPGLLHCRQILQQLSHQRNPINWQTPCKWPCGDVPRVAWLGLIQMLCVRCRLGSWRGSWNWDFFFFFKQKPPYRVALNYHKFAFLAVPFSS